MSRTQKDEKERKTELKDEKRTPALIKKPSSAYLWKILGQGSYNKVWKSNFIKPQQLVAGEPYAGPWILKYPIKDDRKPVLNLMNNKTRAVRIWNEVNSNKPKAGLYKEGWVAPFIENARQATDDEIAQKMIEIFCATGRIVVDALVPGNFLTVEKSEQGKEVILVDVDLALKRGDSPASMAYAENFDIEVRFSSNLYKSNPKASEITKNLLYFEDNLKHYIKMLCNDQQVTLKNIQDLTWLRVNNKNLTLNLFQNIATMNQSGAIVSDVILEALSSLNDESSKETNLSGVKMFF